MEIRVSPTLAAGNFKTLGESEDSGAGFCSGSLLSAQGQESGPSQQAQDVSCEKHGEAATAAGNIWANCKTSPRIRVMRALAFMSGMKIADCGILPRISPGWAFHAADLGTSADGHGFHVWIGWFIW
jgi:hypothetical protein